MNKYLVITRVNGYIKTYEKIVKQFPIELDVMLPNRNLFKELPQINKKKVTIHHPTKLVIATNGHRLEQDVIYLDEATLNQYIEETIRGMNIASNDTTLELERRLNL